MKKILLILLVAIVTFSSCKKEDPIFVCSSTCGEIMSDNVQNYSITIKNDCSGNYKTFNLSQSDWMTAFVGTDYCITNTNPW